MRHTKKYQKPMIATYSIATEDEVAYDFPSSMTMPMNAKDASIGFNDDSFNKISFFYIEDTEE